MYNMYIHVIHTCACRYYIHALHAGTHRYYIHVHTCTYRYYIHVPHTCTIYMYYIHAHTGTTYMYIHVLCSQSASLQEHGEEALKNIARADKNFRVVALGLPVPPYKGNPLDPPLRSRFQARTIFQTPFQTQLEELRKRCPAINDEL